MKLPILLITPFILACCTTSKPFHKNKITKESTWKNVRSIEQHSGPDGIYDLAFVEFGEEGSYYDSSQIKYAKELIQQRKAPLVVVFLHGWHHNAKPTDNDVVRFQRALGLLSKAEVNRNIVGIYLGWRGESLSGPPGLNSLLTYYDRKAAAERLANNFDCFNAIGTCVGATNEQHGRALIVGHSFGGLVLERAVKASLMDASSGGGNVNLNGSLIVTMNPATESVLTRQILDGLDGRLEYDPAQRSYVSTVTKTPVIEGTAPLAVSITSTNDKATGMLFPLSSWIWQSFHPARGWQKVPVPGTEAEVYEARFFRQTPGNSELIHNFTAENPTPAEPKKRAAFIENLHRDYNPNALTFLTSAKQQKQTEGASKETANSGPWQLWSLAHKKNANVPYWVIQVPPEIVNDHGGIWSDNAVAMIAALYRMKFPPQKETGPAPTRPSVMQQPMSQAHVLRQMR